MCVYIPPRADAAVACERIHTTVSRLQTQHPEALFLLSGDFNHVTLTSTLAAFSQFVDCPTRKNRTIDLFYANIKDAYTASPLPPLGKSDHNLIYLAPLYTPLVRKQPTTLRSFRKWQDGDEEILRDCFQSTDWNVMLDSYGDDIEGSTHCITDYLNFCLDAVIPVETVHCFPNNKPWITSEVKAVLNRKKRVFKNKDPEEMRRAQKELEDSITEAKDSYRRKLEKRLQANDMREVWKGMKTITGCKSGSAAAEGSRERANDFNIFFNRFDSTPASPPTHLPAPAPLSCPPPPPPSSDFAIPSISFTVDQVRQELRRLRPRKAAGPDRLCPRLLKACAAELAGPLQHIYNQSLHSGKVPTLWKTSCIIPIPKKGRPRDPEDFRPVVLTSHLMKTLERLVLHIITSQV